LFSESYGKHVNARKPSMKILHAGAKNITVVEFFKFWSSSLDLYDAEFCRISQVRLIMLAVPFFISLLIWREEL
jgi:hypothetical protein